MLYQISPDHRPPNALAFQRVALGPRGARAPECLNPLTEGAIPLLDPAGPAAAHFIAEQPLGAVAELCPASPRRCRAIDDDEWHALLADVPRAPHLGLLIGDDNLLIALLRAGARERVLEVLARVRAQCERLSVFVSVSEDVPGGLDLHDGRAFLSELTTSGADVLVVTSGSRRLPALLDRSRDDDEERRARLFCRAAQWMQPQSVPLLAWTRGVPVDVAKRAAQAAGLDGVCVSRARS